MATNFMQVEHGWDTMSGAALASCLMLLQPNARVGLIAGGYPYHLQPLWGSHPLSDPLLSIESFRVVHDGAGHTRPQKITLIAQWPAAMTGLRVCWKDPRRDRNCCRCGKCMRTILSFRAVGLGLPPCFEHDLTDSEIRSIPPTDAGGRATHRQILQAAEEAGMDGSWVRAARAVHDRELRRVQGALLADYLRRRALALVRR
jgi:hypothetical protein